MEKLVVLDVVRAETRPGATQHLSVWNYPETESKPQGEMFIEILISITVACNSFR